MNSRPATGAEIETSGQARFDPMSEIWWTLPMVVAWVRWRTSDDVRAHCDKFRVTCTDPEQQRRASLWYMRRAETAERSDTGERIFPNETDIAKAERGLWETLECGCPRAVAIDLSTGRRLLIAPAEWREIEVVQEQGRELLRVWDQEPSAGRRYGDVLFRRAEVMAAWPSKPENCCPDRLTLIRPEGPGSMPLQAAAAWIACKGVSENFNNFDIAAWRDAYADLLKRAASNEIAVAGASDGLAEKIDRYRFWGLRVEFPIGETRQATIPSDHLYLSSYVHSGDLSGEYGFDDKLETTTKVYWSALSVLKAEVARWWQFDAAPDPEPIYYTGSPGKPSSKHLYLAEYDARRARNENCISNREEARQLSEWLSKAHPEAPPATPKTIENAMRIHRREQQAQK